jgi:hypothetical protein
VSPERIADTASSGSPGPLAIAIPHVPFIAERKGAYSGCMQTLDACINQRP